MSGNLLLDTNVIIRFVNGVTELFSLFDDEDKLFVSSSDFEGIDGLKLMKA